MYAAKCIAVLQISSPHIRKWEHPRCNLLNQDEQKCIIKSTWFSIRHKHNHMMDLKKWQKLSFWNIESCLMSLDPSPPPFWFFICCICRWSSGTKVVLKKINWESREAHPSYKKKQVETKELSMQNLAILAHRGVMNSNSIK